jgi:hypothetical protein
MIANSGEVRAQSKWPRAFLFLEKHEALDSNQALMGLLKFPAGFQRISLFTDFPVTILTTANKSRRPVFLLSHSLAETVEEQQRPAVTAHHRADDIDEILNKTARSCQVVSMQSGYPGKK